MQGSESAEKHALYVWKELIGPYVSAQHIAIVAHSYGGVVVMHMVCLFCPFNYVFFFQLLAVLFLLRFSEVRPNVGHCFLPF